MIARERIDEIERPRLDAHGRDLDHARDVVRRYGLDAGAIVDEIARFSVAAPSWALGTGGTRFGRFPIGGEPRTTEEKVDDVAALNALTGANRTHQPARAVGRPGRSRRAPRSTPTRAASRSTR